MSELKGSILKTLKKNNIELLDVDDGILRCNVCGKTWVREKSWIFVAEGKTSVRPEMRVDWEGRLPSGWWKCPEGCWRL